jgi:multimeric flavodoxin WrbA
MRIAAIMGGMRKKGNTEILLNEALDQAQKNGASVSKFTLREMTIAPCDGCAACFKTGECIIKDDMEKIYSEMIEADGIIWATPVYFWSMTAITKVVMDRTYALGFPKQKLMNKVGGLILVAGGRGCLNTANIFHMYFNYNHMFSTEFASGYAGEKGAIAKNDYALNAAKEMVNQMTGLIKAGPKFPGEFNAPLPRYVRNKYSL